MRRDFNLGIILVINILITLLYIPLLLHVDDVVDVLRLRLGLGGGLRLSLRNTETRHTPKGTGSATDVSVGGASLSTTESKRGVARTMHHPTASGRGGGGVRHLGGEAVSQ